MSFNSNPKEHFHCVKCNSEANYGFRFVGGKFSALLL
jgi:hypothetical protein